MKKIAQIFFFLILSCPLFAQQNVEAGLFAGLSNYQGDMADDHLVIGETQLAYGAYLSYLLNPKVILRANVFYGKLSGSDKNSPRLAERAYSFNGDVLEGGLSGQWLILGRNRANNSGIFVPQFTPYLSAGVGVARIVNQLQFPNTEANNLLLPEAGDKDYFLVVPLSAGLRYEAIEFLTLGAEIGVRATFSDYVDDVSQAGNPTRNDWYFFAGLTVGYVFGPANNFKF